MSVRLVPAPISLAFSKIETDEEAYELEYQKLSDSDDDPVSQWIKLAKAKGDTSESDPVLLQLMIELHRKIDSLEMLIKDEKPKRISLTNEAHIESIGFEHFKLKEDILVAGQIYYSRILMPVHPKRDVAAFFKAIDGSLVEIIKMHDRDEKEWAVYLTSRERILLREAKEVKKI